MNACLRAVVRTALFRGAKVTGIAHGYLGLINGLFQELAASSVSNIIQRGGTFLKTARCQEFLSPGGRQMAAEQLRRAGIEGLIAIGGDGTFRGAHDLSEEHQVRVLGVPGTIDNDLYGTDYTIGYDTAVNVALEAIDRIRDTAASHDRIFFIEVMGRQAGFIALQAAIAGGAEQVLLPETPTSLEQVEEVLRAGEQRGKKSMIILVAEGEEQGGALEIARELGRRLPQLECRVCILGHIQRGGAPTANDRVLASKLGAAAVEALLAGESDKMVGEIGEALTLTPLPETWQKKKPLDADLLELASMLAT
jgi:6-phosphofructokinase 1